MKRLLIGTFVLGGFAAASNAANLNLDYIITPAGALWSYDLTLSVDTSGSAWAPGQGWTWITFGDVAGPGTSPLSDFVLTSSLPVGPWTALSFSSGGHNGPTWLIGTTGITYWVPAAANETISWTGTSSFHATPGSLFFSELLVQGGASVDNFKEMREVVPEPASMLALASLLPMILRKRRAQK